MSPCPDYWLLDLFSGGGMLGLGVEMLFAEVLGASVRPLAFCEMADYPRGVLNARMSDGTIHCAPILRDATRLPLPDLLGRVDLICAGPPCQPVSLAGRRAAQADGRWLWPAVGDATAALRPRLIFLENVSGIAVPIRDESGEVIAPPPAWDVVSDLSRLGYGWECGMLGSGQVGASHGRKRWWCLGYDPRQCLAHGDRPRLQGRGLLPYSSREQWDLGEGGEPLDLHAWGPDDPRWQDPPTSECPPEPALCGMAHGMADRVDRIKATGNGVDPLAAAVAFALLGQRAGIWNLTEPS